MVAYIAVFQDSFYLTQCGIMKIMILTESGVRHSRGCASRKQRTAFIKDQGFEVVIMH